MSRAEKLHDALRLLAAQWADAASAWDNNPSRWDKAETLRQCASDLAQVIANESAQLHTVDATKAEPQP